MGEDTKLFIGQGSCSAHTPASRQRGRPADSIYVQKVIHYRKHKKECRKCGQCGYYMAYVTTEGTKDHYGDCASIGMNNECNECNNHFKDPDESLLQVDGSEDACGFFKAKRTKRVKEYIKAHPEDYYQDTNFKPLPVR